MSGSSSESESESPGNKSSRLSSRTEKPSRNPESSSHHRSSSKDQDGNRQRSTRNSSSSGDSDRRHSKSSKQRGNDEVHNNSEGGKQTSSKYPSSERSSPRNRNSHDSEKKSPTSSSKHHRDRNTHSRSESRDRSPDDQEHRKGRGRLDESLSSDENNDASRNHSGAASKRRENAQGRGTETLSPKRQKEVDVKNRSPDKDYHRSSRHSSSRDVSQTPSRRKPTLERASSEISVRNLSSRTRSSQRAEKRSNWKEKKDGKSNHSFDDAIDEKVQRRQSMLDTSKRGIIRASASRTRAARDAQGNSCDPCYDSEFDDDDDDNCSVYSSVSYLTTDSELRSDPQISMAREMQRRQSCSYLPSALGTACPVTAPKMGRRPSAFGNSQERDKVIYNNNDSDSDEESVSSKCSTYIPNRLSKNCNFELDRADQFSARRPSMSGSSMMELTVPIVDGLTDSSASVPMRGIRRSSSNKSSESGWGTGASGSSFANRRGSTCSAITMPEVDAPVSRAPRRASTMTGSTSETSKHDKGLEDILRNRRLRGDNSLARNRYAQEEKEEERVRLVEPLKMLSTVGTAGIKGLTTVTNVGIQGVCTVGSAGLNVSKQTAKGISTVGTAGIKGVSAVGNAGLKGVSTVGTAGIKGVSAVGTAGIKGVSTVGTAGIKGVSAVGSAGIKGVSAVGNVGFNVTKQTAKGISTVSRKSVKGISDTISQRSHELEPASTAMVES